MAIAVILLLFGVVILCYFMRTKKDGPEQAAQLTPSVTFEQEGPDYKPPQSPTESTYVFIDVETIGLSPTADAIVQVSALRYFEDKAIDGINTYINPGMPIPVRATNIHGITDSMVKGAPLISQIQKPFLDLVGNAVLVGYNATFDLKFLDRAFNGALDGIKYIDVLSHARSVLALPNYRLETVATHLGFQPEKSFHDSLTDCQATAAVFFGLGLQKTIKFPDTYYSRVKASEPAHEYVSQEESEYSHAGFTAQTYKDWFEAERTRIDGDIKNALQLFDKVKEAGCKSPWLYESYAKAYRKLKDYEREIAVLDEAFQQCGAEMPPVLIDRRERAVELLDARERKEEDLRNKALKREQRAEQRRLQEELAKSKPQKPSGRSVAQCNDDGTVIRVFESVTAAAKEVGVDKKGIRSAANGTQKHSGGFCWKYVDESDDPAE